MKRKKQIIILGSIFLVAIFILVGVLLFLPKKSKYDYTDWQSYVKSYYDKSEKIKRSEEKIYSSEFTLKKNKLYSKDEKLILENVLNIHSVNYKDNVFLYAIDRNGKLYYINNIKNSTSLPYEVTELGDYSNIIKIENRNDQIVATDITNKTYNLSANLDAYIHYAFQ